MRRCSPSSRSCRCSARRGRSGTYRAANLASQARLPITVAMPGRGEPYSPARPTLVRAGDHGFDPAEAHILAGQSIVFLAEAPARVLVELVEPAPPPHAP